VSHLPRLLQVLSVIAKYRLDEFLTGLRGAGLIRFFILPLRLPWLFAPHRNDSRNRRLRLAMEELGPIYIKFGQLLSTRRDFLNSELAEELQSLQDNVPPFSEPSIEAIIKDSLGVESSTIFKELEPTPFASASVAQVHKAILLSGEEVVVKVRRPGIEKTVSEDVRLLKWAARLIEKRTAIGRRLHPVEVVNDYETVIFDELDLQAEGANTTQLKRNFEESQLLYVPSVYWDYSRNNILVLERIHGIPVSNIDSLLAYGIDLKQLAETGVNIFFTQVFEHNFFHADMHPGNIFVSREHARNPQYIAIDCAIIGSLSDADQEYLAQNLLAIFKRDYRRVAELHVRCGWVPPQTRVNEFESAMRRVCEPIFEKPLREISFAHLLLQLFRTAGRFDMEVQPSLVLLQKTLLNVEGLGRQLYPELDLWQTALPFLESWNRRRLDPRTLLTRIRAGLPNWIAQLPDLPEQMLDAVAQSGQLAEINQALRSQLDAAAAERKQRLRRNRAGACLAFVLAAASLLPPVHQWLAGAPTASLGLAALGILLLSFR